MKRVEPVPPQFIGTDFTAEVVDTGHLVLQWNGGTKRLVIEKIEARELLKFLERLSLYD